ncbi:hypothetical protein [Sphingomonas montana]|uniref:hypothetical protein n=1 Tax=Sphingomonas montana TaxID=1843236 RepID=UPI00096CAEC2|nr:hypothetical protein [Sphingomonas montana]
MTAFLTKTFGGLSRQYYLRQLFFGFLIAAGIFWLQTVGRPATPGLLVWLLVNTLLYPYARFVWEGCFRFVFGDNIFFMPALILMVLKLATMMICWMMAILIAPVGLGWLYWHHSRKAPAE